jgi:hypothetical protein
MKRCLLLLLVFPAGCQVSPGVYTPTPPPKVVPVPTRVTESNEVMPLQLGNEWSFELKVENFDGDKSLGSQTQNVTYRVASVSGNRAVLLLEQDNKVVDRQEWEKRPYGLYQVSSGIQEAAYHPAQPAAPLPLEVGKTMKWAGTGLMSDGTIAYGREDIEVLAPQSVDTGVGKLSALPVATVTKFGNTRCENTTWFRPGIGLIRLRQDTISKGKESVVLLTLTNYALKTKTE